MYQMNTELIDTSKMNSLDMDININNRQHNCSISLSTITTADTEDKIEDNNMSLEELRACLNIEAANMKKLTVWCDVLKTIIKITQFKLL